jgi:mono/diheme cytochrome c family protein
MQHPLIGRVLLAAGICGITVLGGVAVAANSPQSSTPSPTPTSTRDTSQAAGDNSGTPQDKHWAFLKQYCSKCHNSEDWAGGIAFDTMTPSDIGTDAKTWEHAVAKLRGRLMPPAGNPQPPNDQVHGFVSYMEDSLDAAAAHQVDAPRVALHRMNRTEYANAIWELLRVKINATQMLPQDDESNGFNNVADVLQVSPAFVDAYISAARQVAIEALGDRSAKPIGVQFGADPGVAGNQEFHVDGLPLGTRGGVSVVYNFPADGTYELSVGNLAAALWVTNMEFRNDLIATYDGKKFFQTSIGGDDDLKSIDQKQDPAVDAINARLKHVKFKASAGPHTVAVTFVQRTLAASEDRLEAPVPGGVQDRVLRIGGFEIKGPYDITGVSQTPSRERIFVCQPKTAADEEPCAREILSRLAERAFRRPVADSDLAPLMNFYAAGRKSADFEEGIRRALTALLASPNFLYRVETSGKSGQVADTVKPAVATPVAATAAPGVTPLSDGELASRLSFFLWSAPPDQELLTLANQGKLHDPQVLKAQVTRLLQDPRATTLASNFAFQWLDVQRLDEIKPDANLFPYVTDPRDDYRQELKLFIDSVFREDQPVTNLLTANYTYLNQRLAMLYGITTVKGDQFRRVTLTDSARWGLLGKGAMLMGTSYPNRTAPVLRGQWILERITGTPPAAPPPAVPSLKENKTGEKAVTVREMMARHRDRPSCFACHGILDPLGLALENFDAVGRWRDKDRMAGTVIDASGVLPDGTKIAGVDDLRKALASDPFQFVQTMTIKLMTYGLGRGIDYQDMPTVRAIVRESAKQDYKFKELIMDIVTSTPFQMRSDQSAAASPSTKTAALIR